MLRHSVEANTSIYRCNPMSQPMFGGGGFGRGGGGGASLFRWTFSDSVPKLREANRPFGPTRESARQDSDRKNRSSPQTRHGVCPSCARQPFEIPKL